MCFRRLLATKTVFADRSDADALNDEGVAPSFRQQGASSFRQQDAAALDGEGEAPFLVALGSASRAVFSA